MPRVTALKINSVWSAHGHTFVSGDAEEWGGNVIGYAASCLTCGAEYVLRATPDAFSDGAYQASNGDDPMACTRDTSMAHGYERHCDSCSDADGCEHCAHECNCLLCS